MENKFDFAKSLVGAAGQFLRDNLDIPLEIATKMDFTDLVTDMDKKVQDFLISEIRVAYPDDKFLAEEDDMQHDIEEGHVWVIDPIDGTSNFVAQKSDFAIVLAYYENGLGQFGLVYDVMAGRLFHGGGRFDVYCNDQQLLPYQPLPLKQSLVGMTPGLYRHNLFGLAQLADQVLGIRSYGSAAITMTKVMSGQLLGYFSHISPWDYAATKIMGEKLGYVTVSMSETPLDFKGRQYVMMVPEQVLPQLKEILELKW